MDNLVEVWHVRFTGTGEEGYTTWANLCHIATQHTLRDPTTVIIELIVNGELVLSRLMMPPAEAEALQWLQR